MIKIKNTTKLLLLLTLSGLFLVVSNSQAAINSQINYQGKLTDDSGVAVADGSYDMIISIYDAASGGSCLWTARGTCGSPTARSVSVSNGIFSIMLGDTGAGDNDLTGLDFNSPYYLGVTVESDSEMTPRKTIGATGYAFNSSMLNGLASATSGADAHILATDASGNATITGTISASNLSGTNTGDQALVDGTTAGQMSFWDGSNWTYTETSEMYWDDMNKRLGIGTDSPTYSLDVRGTTAEQGIRSAMGFDIYNVPEPPNPLSLSLQAGTDLGIGNYRYFVTYTTAYGETNSQYYRGTTITTTAGNQNVLVTLPVSDDPRVTGRKIYRTKVGGSYYTSYFLAEINDNTTTEYLDQIPDASLTTWGLSYGRANTTSLGITSSGTAAMKLDINLTAFGMEAGGTGAWGTAIGYQAGKNVTGAGVTTIGYQAGVSSGVASTFVGVSAGQNATNANNTGVGYQSLMDATGELNVGVGRGTLYVSTGDYNTAVGMASGGKLTATSYFSSFGYQAGYYLADGSTYLEKANYGTYLGARTKASADNVNNEIVIGYNAIGNGSNTTTIGNTDITDSYLRGNLHLGQGAAGTDYTLTFDGETNDGVLTWMEDEAAFYFQNDVGIGRSDPSPIATWLGNVTLDVNGAVQSSANAIHKGTGGGGLVFGSGNGNYMLPVVYGRSENASYGMWFIGEPQSSSQTGFSIGAMVFMARRDSSNTPVSSGNSISFQNGNTKQLVIDYLGDITIGGGAAGHDYKITFNGETNDGVITWMEDEAQFNFDSSVAIGNNLTVGSGAADVDYTLTFNGQSNDTVLTWMEDEDYLKFADDLFVDSAENIYFRDTSIGINSADDGYLDLNADVGIRLTSPLATISNDLTLSSFGAGTLVTDASGNVSVSSDERLKNIDGSFTRGVEDLIELNPISFHWKESTGMDTENAYVGFSAQNVQNFIPEAVGEDSRGYLTLFDRPILATVVNSVKGQQEIMSNISNNISELENINQDLILKTDDNISNIADLQNSIDENLGIIDDKISSQEEIISLLQAQLTDQDNRIKSIEDIAVTLQDTQDLISSRVDLNKADIDYIKMVLGLDGTGEAGNIKISGQLEAEKVVAGAFSVKQTDDKTLGTIIIKAGDISATVNTQAVNINSKVFVTPNQPVEIGVVSIKDRESFEVKINEPLAEDLKVDWWIVDED